MRFTPNAGFSRFCATICAFTAPKRSANVRRSSGSPVGGPAYTSCTATPGL